MLHTDQCYKCHKTLSKLSGEATIFIHRDIEDWRNLCSSCTIVWRKLHDKWSDTAYESALKELMDNNEVDTAV